jgi:hypothetical protein
MAFVKDTSRIWSCKTERNKMGGVISTPNGAEITLMSVEISFYIPLLFVISTPNGAEITLMSGNIISQAK